MMKWLALGLLWILLSPVLFILLFWLKTEPYEDEDDEWDDEDWEYCEHMRKDAPGSCARCEGT